MKTVIFLIGGDLIETEESAQDIDAKLSNNLSKPFISIKTKTNQIRIMKKAIKYYEPL